MKPSANRTRLRRIAPCFVLALAGCLDPEIGTTSEAADADAAAAGDSTIADASPEAGTDVPATSTPDALPELVPAPAGCLTAAPASLDFGGKLCHTQATLELTLTACAPTTVTGLALRPHPDEPDQPPSAAFGLPLPSEPPWQLGSGDTVDVQVRYVPTALAELGADGAPVPDRAAIVARDAAGELLVASVHGFGVEQECATAVIEVAEGEEVATGTLLHLDASKSFAGSCAGPGSGIAAYAWSVIAPPGATEVFDPSDSVAQPTYLVSAPGTYVFSMQITTDEGFVGCVAAEYQVIASP